MPGRTARSYVDNDHPDSLHRCHDVSHLFARWRRGCRPGMEILQTEIIDEFPLYMVRHRKPGAPQIYLSAGIHGDEPAATEALLVLATEHRNQLAEFDCTIWPCLNPWGLANNSRFSARGTDLNREWNSPAHPVAGPVGKALGQMRFRLALTLHEDFEARGFYLYEIPSLRPHWGEGIAKAAGGMLPLEPRRLVDGHRCRGGIIRRRETPDILALCPEAIFLHRRFADRSLTLETPSEFSLSRRVQGMVAAVLAALDLARRPVSCGR